MLLHPELPADHQFLGDFNSRAACIEAVDVWADFILNKYISYYPGKAFRIAIVCVEDA